MEVNMNGNIGVQGGQALRKLLQGGPERLQQGLQGLMQWHKEGSPLAILSQIMGAATVPLPVEPLDEVSDTIKKQVIKNTKKQVDEAMFMGGMTGQQILESANIPNLPMQEGATSSKTEGTTIGQSTQPTQQPQQEGLTGMDLLKGLLPMLALPEMVKTKLEKGRAEVDVLKGKAGQQERAFQQDIAKLEYTYDLKLRNELLKPDASANETLASANVFKQDFYDFVRAFENIPIKGRGFGLVGAMGAAVGIGREERAEYETLGEMLAYSLAATKAKQEGRALDREELKRFRNLIKIKTGATEGEKIGSFNVSWKNPFGLTWDGGNLWISGIDLKRIYKVTTSGALKGSWPSPKDIPSGLAFRDSFLYNCDLGATPIWKLNALNCSQISSFDAPGSAHTGLTWDGSFFWLADWDADLIYKLDIYQIHY